MSGVQRLAAAENKGMKQVSNEQLMEEAMGGSKMEQSEKYGEEKE